MKNEVKEKAIFTAIVVIIIAICVLSSFSEPELVVSNSYKHRGDYNGNYYHNTYTFEIKNKSRFKDVESVDYFRIYFYDNAGDCVGVWNAETYELLNLALEAGDDYVVQIDVAESLLPYDGGWSYDTEYSLNYYD